MIENRKIFNLMSHLILIVGVLLIAFPLYIALVTATLSFEEVRHIPLPLLPSSHLLENLKDVFFSTSGATNTRFIFLLLNSFIMALVITLGKLSISMIAAFAITYFRFPFRKLTFAVIFLTLMLPVEVRIMPTFQIVADLNLINSYTGLTLPLIASATATFLFRQFFMTIPKELIEASMIDGCGPMRFFKDILFPLSKSQLAALFVIMFIFGWNQYLWPLLITTDESMYTALVGIKRMISLGDSHTKWNMVMSTALVTLIPPFLVIMAMQKFFVKSMIDSEK